MQAIGQLRPASFSVVDSDACVCVVLVLVPLLLSIESAHRLSQLIPTGDQIHTQPRSSSAIGSTQVPHAQGRFRSPVSKFRIHQFLYLQHL